MKRILLITLLQVVCIPVFASWNGNASPWTQGNGTEYNPYQISTSEQLAYLAEMVNAGVSDYSGQYFLLTNDISLSNREWTPIGLTQTTKFRGNFDGGGYSIDSLMLIVNSSIPVMSDLTKNLGLFGFVENGEISNLDVVVNTQFLLTLTTASLCYVHIAGIAANAVSETFTNCQVNGSLLLDYHSLSLNGSTIYNQRAFAAGIVGRGYNTVFIAQCVNNCAIYGSEVGGIVQNMRSDSTNFSIVEDCVNNGFLEGYYHTAGIVGSATGNVDVVKCANKGNVARRVINSFPVMRGSHIGGVCGDFNVQSGSISMCYNDGNITAGGIADEGSSSAYRKCRIGGIVATTTSNSVVEYCYNRGNISVSPNSSTIASYFYVAGVKSLSYGSAKSSYNTGNLSSTSSNVHLYGCINGGAGTNCYYRSGCGATTGGTARSADNMKTSVFVTMLNADSLAYMMDVDNINDGYPIHTWRQMNVYTDTVYCDNPYEATMVGHYEGTPSAIGFLCHEVGSTAPFTEYQCYTPVSPAFRSATGLTPNTLYECCFYADKNGNRYCGDTLTFRSLAETADTSSGGGTSADTVFIFVHDTVVVNNYLHDTTVVNHYVFDTVFRDNYIFDTTVINHYFHDTLYVDNFIRDTVYVSDCDSLIYSYIHDTVFLMHYDTTIYQYVHDTAFVWRYDTVYINNYFHDTVYMTRYDTLYSDIVYRNLAVTSGNVEQGLAAGSGRFPQGTIVEIAAVPIEGNRFLQWSDGSIENPRSIVLNDDVTMMAIFSYESINLPNNKDWNLFAERGALVITGALGKQVRIYDVTGRLLKSYSYASDRIIFDVPASGGYIVQVGDGAAKKTTVIR